MHCVALRALCSSLWYGHSLQAQVCQSAEVISEHFLQHRGVAAVRCRRRCRGSCPTSHAEVAFAGPQDRPINVGGQHGAYLFQICLCPGLKRRESPNGLRHLVMDPRHAERHAQLRRAMHSRGCRAETAAHQGQPRVPGTSALVSGALAPAVGLN